MCTKLPNWKTSPIQRGSSGYVTTAYYEAGESFYDRIAEDYSIIKFTNLYFKDFIADKPDLPDVIID